MRNPNLNLLFYTRRLCAAIAAAFLLTSCVAAQTDSLQTNSSQVKQPDNTANRQIGDSTRLQSVKSCKVLDLPENFSAKNFDPIGGYKIYGKKSEAFEEFNNFTLDKVFDKNAASSANKIVGGVVVNGGGAESDTFQITEISISAAEIRFSTESLKNTRYEFSGQFLKKGAFSRYNEKNTPVLKGVLKKFESDKMIAEKELQFKFVVWKAKIAVPNC